MKKNFNVYGMMCVNCVNAVEKGVKKLNGVKEVEVSLLDKSLTVDFDEQILSTDDIIKTVKKLGYKISIQKENANNNGYNDTKILRNRFFISFGFLIVLMYFSMGEMIGLPVPERLINFIFQWILATIIIGINFKFFINGFKAVINLAPNMDTLISLGSGAAYIYSVVGTISFVNGVNVSHLFFESSAMVLSLVTLGKWFEEMAKERTGLEITKLSKMLPDVVNAIIDGVEQKVKVSNLKIGDVIILRAGDFIPVDGRIINGNISVDKSAINGESLPVELGIDDLALSGCIVKNGFAQLCVNSVGEDTLFSKIIESVKKAGASKAPIQKLADKISAYFVPIVSFIAIITFTIWMIISSDLYSSFNYGISVLVISCPCSLGLATPVAVMVAMGKGASNGILFKNAKSLQNLRRIDCIIFDKTATLTEGKPIVFDAYFNDLSKEEINIIYQMEDKSSHPLGEAVKEYLNKNYEIKLDPNFEIIFNDNLVGKGLVAEYNNKNYYLGNEKILPKNIKIDSNLQEKIENFTSSTVIFANDTKIIAIFFIEDRIKDTSFSIISELNDLKINTVMCTGDKDSIAVATAKKLGIKEYHAEVMPNEKSEIVLDYKKQGKFVSMCGDGINDSVALKESDVGIALGSGTDIAIESADMVLTDGDLSKIKNGINLSKKTFKIIKQNLFWAFIYNSISIPIAAGVLSGIGVMLTPIIASACMSLSSLFVVLNALRLRRFDKND